MSTPTIEHLWAAAGRMGDASGHTAGEVMDLAIDAVRHRNPHAVKQIEVIRSAAGMTARPSTLRRSRSLAQRTTRRHAASLRPPVPSSAPVDPLTQRILRV